MTRFDQYDSGGVYSLYLESGHVLTLLERGQTETHLEGWNLELFELEFDRPVQDVLDESDPISVRYDTIVAKIFHGSRQQFDSCTEGDAE